MNVALHPTPINIISLCTGGGGLNLGVELAMPDARAIVYLEREAFAVAHLVAAMQAGLMAQAPVWSDVRTFDGRLWRGLVDGIIGGIPCQPHSLAGKRLGKDDERDLWSAARRIIVHARPWFVLIENVGGMLSSGGAERVVRDLRRLGFEVEVGLFSASEVGATHQRERVFILAVGAMDDAAGVRFDVGPGPEPIEPGWSGWPVAADHDFAVADADHGQSPIRLRLGGNPQQEREAAAGIRRAVGHAARLGGGAISVRQGESQLSAADIAGAGTNDALGLSPPGPADLDGWRRVLEDSPHLEPAIRVLADGLAARLDLAGPHAGRIERLRLLGNGVVPLQAAYALRTLIARLAASGSAGAARLVHMTATPTPSITSGANAVASGKAPLARDVELRDASRPEPAPDGCPPSGAGSIVSNSDGGVKESPASIPDYNGVKSPALVTAHGLSGKSCPLSRVAPGPSETEVSDGNAPLFARVAE